MTEKSDIRPLGILICIFAGGWLLTEAGGWRIGCGIAFIVFGAFRCYKYIQENAAND